MDSQRAKQIMESLGVINVHYHNTPVWLEQIKEEGMAEVRNLNNDQRMEVPVDELVEADSFID